MSWLSPGTRGDKENKGKGSYLVKWSISMVGKRGGKITAHKQQRFATRTAAEKFCRTKRANPKVFSCSIDGD